MAKIPELRPQRPGKLPLAKEIMKAAGEADSEYQKRLCLDRKLEENIWRG